MEKQFGPHGAEEEKETFVQDSDLDRLAEQLWGETSSLNGNLGHTPGAVGGGAIGGLPNPPLASHNDPLGSWTGVPTEGSDTETDNEVPTQDADDL